MEKSVEVDSEEFLERSGWWWWEREVEDVFNQQRQLQAIADRRGYHEQKVQNPKYAGELGNEPSGEPKMDIWGRREKRGKRAKENTLPNEEKSGSKGGRE
jgi:hypothetical protein